MSYPRAIAFAAIVLGLLYFLVTPSVVMLPPPDDYGPAKPLSGPDLSGKTVSLSDFSGKVVVVDFWATWCPPCKREIPGLQELYVKEGERGLVILGAAVDNDPSSVAPFVRAHGITYPIILTPGGVDGWRGPGYPMAFLVERGGKIARTYVGEKDMDYLRADVRAALKR